MAKNVNAKADIERLHSRGITELKLHPGDAVTPLARDSAIELGVKIYAAGEEAPATAAVAPAPAPAAFAPMGAPNMEDIVKAVLEQIQKAGGMQPCPVPDVYGSRPAALKLVPIGKDMVLDPYDLNDPKTGALLTPPEIDFRLTDVVTVGDGSSIGAGFMSWRKGAFEWTLTYDEMDYIVEGVMEITCEGRTLVAYAGDVCFIPAGSHVRWATPSWVKIYYVTFPSTGEY